MEKENYFNNAHNILQGNDITVRYWKTVMAHSERDEWEEFNVASRGRREGSGSDNRVSGKGLHPEGTGCQYLLKVPKKMLKGIPQLLVDSNFHQTSAWLRTPRITPRPPVYLRKQLKTTAGPSTEPYAILSSGKEGRQKVEGARMLNKS